MKFLVITLVAASMVGCLGIKHGNPMKGKTETVDSPKIWWAQPVTDDPDNPWNAFLPKEKAQNDFDPWANDDLQRYTTPVKPKPVVPTPEKRKPTRRYLSIPQDRGYF